MPDSTLHRSAPAAEPDDFSGHFQPLRQQLVSDSGGRYLAFVTGLSPRYWRAWLDILLGYLFLALVIALVGLASPVPAQLAAVLAGAVATGYGLAYLQLFLHEAAHFNLARDRRRNDWLCDAFISWQVGTTVRRYRPIHFAHHRHLGTTADTENSYFRPLDWQLILETLAGVHALRILRQRRQQLDGPAATGGQRALLRGVALHALAGAAAFAVSGWAGLATWVLGMGVFYPVFATLRQLLEHRSPGAEPTADYRRQDHGALTRMFGRGPLASTFGGAGFNRHLLHHWEPQVSYTRLAELENHLQGTRAAGILGARHASYLGTLVALWRAPAGPP